MQDVLKQNSSRRKLFEAGIGFLFLLVFAVGLFTLPYLFAQPPGGGPPGFGPPGFGPPGFGPPGFGPPGFGPPGFGAPGFGAPGFGGPDGFPLPPPPIMRALDVDENGQISADEIAKSIDRLKSLDGNKDGQLTPEEIGEMNFFGPGGPGGGGRGGPPGMGGERQLISTYDKDGDGRLNAEERTAARAAPRQNLGRGPGGPGGGPGGGLEGPGGGPDRGPGGGPDGGPGNFGFGGPGGPGGPGGGRNREPAQLGKKLQPKDVVAYSDRDELYDTKVLRTLFLQFDNEDWEVELEDFNNTDVEVPATLVVDGKTYPEIGVHFRGMSSYSSVPRGYKRSLNLTIDHGDSKQRLYGYKTLNLLNANGDSSFMSSVLYSHMARQVIPAPKANFVRVVINGENWGVYVNVEQFNKDFLKENYATTQGARWKVQGSPNGDGGLRYMGDRVDDYRRRYVLKSTEDEQAWRDLIELCRVIDQTPPNELESALGKILDIDETLWFLALDCALINSDGYWTRASDYSIYQDSNHRFHVIPHDMNEAFHGSGGPGGPRGPSGGGPGGGSRGGLSGPGGGFGGPGGPGDFGGPGVRPERGGIEAGPPLGGDPNGLAQNRGEEGRRRGPGGFGPPSGGGGFSLDPLVGLEDTSKPLRSRLLAVPSLRDKYLQRVRAIADSMLDWNKLGPSIAQWRALIERDVQEDTKKLSTYDAFLAATSDQVTEGQPRGRSVALRAFADQRRTFLIQHADVSRVAAAPIAGEEPRIQKESGIVAMKTSLDFAKRPVQGGPKVVINEFMASNTKTLRDSNGDYDDWIELYNPSEVAVSLDGMYLTDTDRAPRKWIFPDGTTIPAGGYLIIWTDEQGKSKNGLHANFKLSAKGEAIYLVDRDDRENTVIDYVQFDKQADDVSYGRNPKTISQWLPLAPTPGGANKTSE